MKLTCYVSYISYMIEKWMHDGDDREEIRTKIKRGKRKKRFPEELEFLDSYLDIKYGSSGCAFRNKLNGQLILGFAGTNYRSGILEGTKDVLADAYRLGVTGMEENCVYLECPQNFVETLVQQGYRIDIVTGHSLGGALAIYMGVYNNVPEIVTYNGAPLYMFEIGDRSHIRERVESYEGKITRYVSSNDPLNMITGRAAGYYPGQEIKLEDTEGHAMINFLQKDF